MRPQRGRGNDGGARASHSVRVHGRGRQHQGGRQGRRGSFADVDWRATGAGNAATAHLMVAVSKKMNIKIQFLKFGIVRSDT